MENQPSGRRRRVDVLGQGPEACTALADRRHDFQKVFQRPGEAVVFGDGHNVTVAELIQHPVQLGPLALRPADLVGEQLASSGRFQGVGLGIEVLVVRADASVSGNPVSM